MEAENNQKASSKMSLITNNTVDLWNTQDLQYGYFQSGSIYLGAKEALNNEVFDKNIGAILTVMDRKSYEKEKIKEKIINMGLQDSHLYIESQDHVTSQLSKYYEMVFGFIEKHLNEGKNILVHCKGGMSRSPAILCSYLMRKHKLPFEKSYQLLKSRRNVITINEGFQKELKKFEEELGKYQKK